MTFLYISLNNFLDNESLARISRSVTGQSSKEVTQNVDEPRSELVEHGKRSYGHLNYFVCEFICVRVAFKNEKLPRLPQTTYVVSPVHIFFGRNRVLWNFCGS